MSSPGGHMVIMLKMGLPLQSGSKGQKVQVSGRSLSGRDALCCCVTLTFWSSMDVIVVSGIGRTPVRMRLWLSQLDGGRDG